MDHGAGMRPASNSGQTFSSRAAAIAPFSATERGRRVEPVRVSRFSMMGRKLISTLVPLAGRRSAPAARRCASSSILRVDIVAADHVEDHVDALAAGRLLDRPRRSPRLVVDGLFGAKLLAGRRISRAVPAVAKTRAPKRLGQLDRGRADAAGAAMDEEDLARLQPAALEHIGPDGEEGLRQRRRLDQVEQPFGTGRHCGAGATAVLGIAAAGDQRADLVALAPARVPARQRGDRPGDIEAGRCRARPAAADSCPGAAARRAG